MSIHRFVLCSVIIVATSRHSAWFCLLIDFMMNDDLVTVVEVLHTL